MSGREGRASKEEEVLVDICSAACESGHAFLDLLHGGRSSPPPPPPAFHTHAVA